MAANEPETTISMTSRENDAATREQATRLCTSCGLCCAGAIHNHVNLEAGEIESARALNLPVGERKGRSVFPLPCPRMAGTTCSIYAQRPNACRGYRCQLLQDLDAGRTDLAVALETVAIARQLVEQALAVLPPTMTLPAARLEARRSTLASRGMIDATDRATMEWKLRVTALTHYIDRHFMTPGDGQWFLTSDLAPVECKEE